MGRSAAGICAFGTRPYGFAGIRWTCESVRLVLVFAAEIQAGLFSGDEARDIWTMLD
jgi:hypothetical protein